MATANDERGPVPWTSELPWVYEPLSEDYHTRVLELYPAVDTITPLRGRFRYGNLDTNLCLFDAISYTWGEPNFTENIIIDKYCCLPITQNLRDALTRFRHPVEMRSIWADAICINQKDNEDKRRQIPLIAEIYRCASSVLVWLGKDSKVDMCLSNIAILSRKRRAIEQASLDLAKDTSALTELASVSWFTRRWVIQEVVLNPHVMFYGRTTSLPWLRIVQLLNLIPAGESPPILHLRALKAIWDVRSGINAPNYVRSEAQEIKILDLMGIFSDTVCVDGRDRIYALAGLANDVIFNQDIRRGEKKILISIDYTKTVEQVYLDFALAVVKAGSGKWTQRLLMEAAQRANARSTNAPSSWVPDWRQPVLRPKLSIDRLSAILPEWTCFSKPQVAERFGRRILIPEEPWLMISADKILRYEVRSVSAPFPTNYEPSSKLEWLHSAFSSIKGFLGQLDKKSKPVLMDKMGSLLRKLGL